MKSEPKAFASLSSGLLARKGAARPAMRPQGFGQMGSNLEDLGWDDMGFEPPKPAVAPLLDADHDAFGEELSEPALRNPIAALTPIASPVHDQRAEIADRFGAQVGDEEEEEADETAELYDPEEEPAPVAILPQVKPIRTAAPIVAAPVFAPSPSRARTPRAAPGSKGKAAFTLRLDAARHLKLRLACAVTGRSAQLLVTDALDQLLASMPELDSMADKAPGTKRRA